MRGPPSEDEPGIGALTIAGYAREVTERYAGREAVVAHPPGGRVSWTYAELWDRSVEVARALIATGADRDCRVGVLMTNRPEYLASVFGIALAGGVTVALSTFSTANELEHLLAAAGVSILLFDRQVLGKDFAEMLVGLEPRIAGLTPGERLRSTRFPFLRRLVALDCVTHRAERAAHIAAIESWDAFLAGGNGVPDEVVTARDAATRPADVGAIFFSSGTTSRPKGIVHAQRALALQWWRWPWIMGHDPAHPVRFWTGNGLFWSGNISMVVGNAFSSGGTAVLQPVFDAEQALALMERERVSFPMGRPHQWTRLEASPRWLETDLSALHYVTYGTKLLEHPTVRTEWRMGPAFGTTETLTVCTVVPANTPEAVYRGSFGQPLPGNLIKILDPATGVVVPRGERGEIAVRGPTLMLGYLGKTSEQSFDDEGFFRTGDGGYVDDEGWLFWEGRLTEMIKTGGANVSPLEVDEVIATYPGVKLTQTVGVPDASLGEMVVSCVVPHDDAVLDLDALARFLKARLASFKLPRRVLVFDEQDFTVTGSGKIKFAIMRDKVVARLSADAGSGA